ncbi:MAG: nitroreductase family protein [Candidatus Woesearchaeota archaeon]
MEVFECIKTRRSIRRYMDAPVEWEKIGRILEAGKAAPSAGNLQNWSFIVVLDQGQRSKIAEACLKQDWIAEAPVHIVVAGLPEKAKRFYGIRGERLYTIQNCAAATENMLLMAHALGLGSCWVGAFDEDILKDAVSMPQEVRPQAVLTIGYANEQVPEPPEFTLENVMYFRDYGGQPNRIKDIPKYTKDFSIIIDRNLQKGKGTLKRVIGKLKGEK